MIDGGYEKSGVWRDLVADFLEMACFLTPQEQNFLLEALEKESVAAETIHVYPGFLIDGRMVMITEEPDVQALWLYNPKAGVIRKHGLRQAVAEAEV